MTSPSWDCRFCGTETTTPTADLTCSPEHAEALFDQEHA